MIQRPLGNESLSDSDAGALLHGVLDAGITLIDTAPSYGVSEERIGRHLASRRREFVLSSVYRAPFQCWRNQNDDSSKFDGGPHRTVLESRANLNLIRAD